MASVYREGNASCVSGQAAAAAAAAGAREILEWTWQGMGPLHVACARGFLRVINRFLQMGLELSDLDEHGAEARSYLVLAPASAAACHHYWSTPPSQRASFNPFLSALALAQEQDVQQRAAEAEKAEGSSETSDLDTSSDHPYPYAPDSAAVPGAPTFSLFPAKTGSGRVEAARLPLPTRVGWSLTWRLFQVEVKTMLPPQSRPRTLPPKKQSRAVARRHEAAHVAYR